MMPLSWWVIPAILCTFIFVFVPGFLWLVDRIFRKPLGEPLFKVSWNWWGLGATVLCWIMEFVF